MTLDRATCLTALAAHSAGLADAATTPAGRAAAVEHCPGWSVADLVAHVTGVQWFWATIVEERLSAPPAESRRPPRAPDDGLADALRDATDRLVRALDGSDPTDACWTWAPGRQDVGFVLRHQVQEAAVHHWDAAHASGGSVTIAPAVAADAVDEFLTFSLSSEEDPADPPRPALDGRLLLRATDTGDTWLLHDGSTPGTVALDRDAEPDRVSEVAAPAEDLLLWLYGRRAADTGAVPGGLADRFRALIFTD